MDYLFRANFSKIRLLVLAEVDSFSASLISEKFVRGSPQFDVILVCGPFIGKEYGSAEAAAAAEGDMAGIIAQLENIVCRVIYLAAESDPTATLTEQLYLTPNSVNIHARRLNLADGVSVLGFTEKSENLLKGKVPENIDRSAESDEELEDVEVHSSTPTIKLLEEILSAEDTAANNFDKETIYKFTESHPQIAAQSANTGAVGKSPNAYSIFVFNYKYAHSLSHFLFHMTDCTEKANVKLCIIPSVSTATSDVQRLPNKFGNINIVAPKSFKNTGEYVTINLEMDETGTWHSLIDHCKI